MCASSRFRRIRVRACAGSAVDLAAGPGSGSSAARATSRPLSIRPPAPRGQGARARLLDVCASQDAEQDRLVGLQAGLDDALHRAARHVAVVARSRPAGRSRGTALRRCPGATPCVARRSASSKAAGHPDDAEILLAHPPTPGAPHAPTRASRPSALRGSARPRPRSALRGEEFSGVPSSCGHGPWRWVRRSGGWTCGREAQTV